MTPLQILRSMLKDGVMLTLSHRVDGYRVEVTETDAAGQTLQWVVVHPRLEQALFQMVERAEVSKVAVHAGQEGVASR